MFDESLLIFLYISNNICYRTVIHKHLERFRNNNAAVCYTRLIRIKYSALSKVFNLLRFTRKNNPFRSPETFY